MWRAARLVRRILALGHDAFEAHLAGVAEHGLTVVGLQMFVEPDAGASLGNHGCERGLAHLKRILAQVVAVQLDQVKGVQEHASVGAVVTNEIGRCKAVLVAGDGLAVEDAGARAQTRQGLDDQLEAVG
jgi:hypothetical protein